MLQLLAAAVVLLFPSPVQDDASTDEAPRDERRAALTAYLEELREARELPGISAALVLADGTELAVAVGYASQEQERGLQPADLLLSGSIGKTYVAATVLQLVHQEQLGLDERVSKHLGDREWFERLPNGDALTVRQLLRHQSGLGRYVYERAFALRLVEEPDKVWKPDELVGFVLDRPALFAPGESFAYSDTNYILLGMIIEQATGKRYYDLVQERFLEPHGLAATVPSDRRVIEGLVQGYDKLFGPWGLPERVIDDDGRFVINPQFEWCGGGFANTPQDLARWARLLYAGRAFDGPYLDWMLDAVPAEQLGPGVRYGPALMLRETDLGAFRGHDGVMTGYSSSMGYFVDLDVGAAVQTNASRPATFGKPGHDVLVDLVRIVQAASRPR